MSVSVGLRYERKGICVSDFAVFSPYSFLVLALAVLTLVVMLSSMTVAGDKEPTDKSNACEGKFSVFVKDQHLRLHGEPLCGFSEIYTKNCKFAHGEAVKKCAELCKRQNPNCVGKLKDDGKYFVSCEFREITPRASYKENLDGSVGEKLSGGSKRFFDTYWACAKSVGCDCKLAPGSAGGDGSGDGGKGKGNGKGKGGPLGCQQNEDCRGQKQICDLGTSTCVECLQNNDCEQGLICIENSCEKQQSFICDCASTTCIAGSCLKGNECVPQAEC